MDKNYYRKHSSGIHQRQYKGANMNYGVYRSTAMSLEERVVEEESKKKIKKLYQERIKNLKG